MATKHVSRLPHKKPESVPLRTDIVMIPTLEGGFVLADLTVHTIRFKARHATYLVNPIPIDRLYGPHVIVRAMETGWDEYAIYRTASITSSDIDLSDFDIRAIAFSAKTMHLMLLVESDLRIGGYHRVGLLQPIPILEVTVVS